MHRSKSTPFNMTHPAHRMREKAMNEALKRKEEYLGARVPRELKQRVLKKAENLGIPVSILIRNVLEQAFSTEIQEQIGSNKVSGAADLEQRPEKPQILAWKSIELNEEHACDNCGCLMNQNQPAVMAITRSDDDMMIVCQSCKTQLQGK